VAEIVNPAMSSDGWALLLKDDLVTMPHGCKEDSSLAGSATPASIITSFHLKELD
jgi:hypothetical protein